MHTHLVPKLADMRLRPGKGLAVIPDQLTEVVCVWEQIVMTFIALYPLVLHLRRRKSTVVGVHGVHGASAVLRVEVDSGFVAGSAMILNRWAEWTALVVTLIMKSATSKRVLK